MKTQTNPFNSRGAWSAALGASIPGWLPAAEDGNSSVALPWLFTLPNWALLAFVALAFAILFLFVLAVWRRLHPQAQRAGRAPYYCGAAIGALAGIAVALLFADVWKAYQTEAITALAPTAAGKPPLGARADLERLSQAMAALHTQYQVAGPGQRPAIAQQMKKVALERRDYLASIIKDNPDEVLRVALPGDMRANLPEEVQELVEEETDQEGEIETLHVDFEDPTKNEYRYFLKSQAGERISLHFAANAPDVLTGTKVRAHGVLLRGAGPTDLGETDGSLAVGSGTADLETLALTSTSISTTSTTSTTVLPNTFGPQKTLVILVNFPDKATQPYTADTARSVVFTSTSNFDLENSFQQTSLQGDVAGWLAISLSSTTCDYNTLASQARQAAINAGFILSNYTRLIYGFPQNACTWWGLGTVGGNPSQAWINGSIALKVVGHEMGHNFGLYHAHTLECGTATLGTSCTTNEYGDTIDMMGGSAAGHYDAFEKERLGWLSYGASPDMATAQTAGTYWLDVYEAAASVNPKALKILKSTDPTTGKKTWYYVEYRQAVGFDGFLSKNSNVLSGVVVRTGAESSGNTSNLLDMSPTSPTSFNYPALALGQSFTDPDAAVTVTPTSMDGTVATVEVSFGAPTCTRANPTVSLSPAQSQWVQAGTPVTFTATITNKDNSACAASTFNIGATVPSGWSAALDKTVLNLPPGASGTAALTVTSPASALDGFYTATVSVVNGAATSYAASGSGTVVLVSSLQVSVTTNKTIYTANQTVTATTTVMANGSPVASATVNFTFTKSNGSKTNVSVATDSAGTARATLRIARRDPAGVYGVSAQVSAGSLSGSASTSFMVQ